MHLVFVTTPRGNGGSELLWLATARRALQQGHRVTVVCYDDTKVWPDLRELCDGGADLVRRPEPKKRNALRRMWW